MLAAYAAVRAGLRAMLEDAAGIESVSESPLGAGNEAVLLKTHPDVVVYDVNEPDWAATIAEARAAEAALVLLTDETSIGSFGLRDPGRGFAWLHKDVDREELLSAVIAVSAGLVVLDRVTSRRAQTEVFEFGRAGPGQLSTREHQVLQLMSEGLPNKQIAQRLGISNSTAKFHVASVLAKLDATSRTEAVTTGVRRGLIAV